jgi:hypothetical protein
VDEDPVSRRQTSELKPSDVSQGQTSEVNVETRDPHRFHCRLCSGWFLVVSRRDHLTRCRAVDETKTVIEGTRSSSPDRIFTGRPGVLGLRVKPPLPGESPRTVRFNQYEPALTRINED